MTFGELSMENNIHIAEFFLRVFAGILFVFQGYDKLFRIKITGVVEAFSSEAAIYQVPKWMLVLLAYYTSLIEFIGGISLLLGLFSTYALYFLGIDLILVGLAFSFVEPMWDIKHVFPRFIFIILLLLLPSGDNQYSFDYLIFGHQIK